MKTIETLRNTLLVTSLLLLVYVLYKRMLHIFKKQSIQIDYPELSNEIHWINDKLATVTVKLEKPTSLEIDVCDAKGALKIKLVKNNFDSGEHSFSLDLSGFSTGRYYYKVTSDKQQASQYFDVV